MQDANRFLQPEDALAEDMGIIFFDADTDKDLDMYVVSRSYELPPKPRNMPGPFVPE